MTHFSKNKILTSVQHDFRSKHSCESQLLIATDKLIQNFESKTQTDDVVLDFSKAFDVVPHQRLLHKLDHFRIWGATLNWLQNFKLIINNNNKFFYSAHTVLCALYTIKSRRYRKDASSRRF